jgi:hypothetical protein
LISCWNESIHLDFPILHWNQSSFRQRLNFQVRTVSFLADHSHQFHWIGFYDKANEILWIIEFSLRLVILLRAVEFRSSSCRSYRNVQALAAIGRKMVPIRLIPWFWFQSIHCPHLNVQYHANSWALHTNRPENKNLQSWISSRALSTE